MLLNVLFKNIPSNQTSWLGYRWRLFLINVTIKLILKERIKMKLRNKIAAITAAAMLAFTGVGFAA